MARRDKRKTVSAIAWVAAVGFVPFPLAQAEESATSRDTTQKVGKDSRQTFNDGVKQGKLETALMFSEQLNTFKIDTDVSGNRAILKGEVSDDIEKELAGEVAKGVDGIDEVDNQLSVTSAAHRRDPETEQGLRGWVRDVGITAELKAEFLANAAIDGVEIDVSTERGVVTLEGEVDTKVAKDLAEQIARTAENVNGVKNRLSVKES